MMKNFINQKRERVQGLLEWKGKKKGKKKKNFEDLSYRIEFNAPKHSLRSSAWIGAPLGPSQGGFRSLRSFSFFLLFLYNEIIGRVLYRSGFPNSKK